MGKMLWLSVLGLAVLAAAAPAAYAQRPYIGYVYPAGGQQGTTFQIRLGGQNLDGVDAVTVSGTGVQAKVVEYFRRLNNQETALMREQLNELRQAAKAAAAKEAAAAKSKTAPAKNKAAPTKDKPAPATDKGAASTEMGMSMMEMGAAATDKGATAAGNEAATIMARIEKRFAENVQTPACASICSLAFVEVTVAPDAKPGPHEIRLVTPRGVSNPLVFDVGQVPEFSRKPMTSASLQVLGKEEQALRKRPPEEEEMAVTVPCTANGQMASGEVNRHRFQARKGQRLVITTEARQLIPYLADAVPGWFQPVLRLYDAHGKEVAYDDDYRFKPDPIIFFEVPQDGEYVLAITDALYRGREDFVYRVTIGELPFVTGIFPLGGRAGALPKILMKGWNLDAAQLVPPAKDAEAGVYQVTAVNKNGLVSNGVPFAVDTLPEASDQESNNDPAHAQKVTLPVIVNGRIDRKDDWDVFQFTGHAGDTVVAEVYARRLDSPLDSLLKVTDAKGNVLALNDDCEDLGSGLNTHHADSYVKVALPADGTYYVHLGDTARCGGPEYAYRLRISAPRPDFALRVVPTSVGLRSKNSASLPVYVLRKDGFTGPIKLNLKNPPQGFSATPATLTGTQEVVQLGLKADATAAKQPLALVVEGRAKIEDRDVAHVAVPAEDRMQAFLWRHMVPAEELKALAFDPAFDPPPKRVPPPISPELQAKAKADAANLSAKNQKFSKSQVSGRLRQLKTLFEDGLLTDDFYNRRVAECQAAQ